MAVGELEKIMAIRRKVIYEDGGCSWEQNDGKCNENGVNGTAEDNSSGQITGLQQNGSDERMNVD
ncbi:hypothetical protein OSTOST_23618 [Ostertagia ostertagi]